MPTCVEPKQSTTPASDNCATLQIYTYITNRRYDFQAYIYQFAFSVAADVQENKPFGRTSRIFTHGGTTRQDLTISFYELVNSHSEVDFIDKYARASEMIKEMYPDYESVNNSLTMTKAPLFRIYSPLYITNGYTGIAATDPASELLPFGLLGYIKSIQISFDRSTDGAFEVNGGEASLGGAFFDPQVARQINYNGDHAYVSPKINYSITFAPIEDADLGFESGMWSNRENSDNWAMGFSVAGASAAPGWASPPPTAPEAATESNDASAGSGFATLDGQFFTE